MRKKPHILNGDGEPGGEGVRRVRWGLRGKTVVLVLVTMFVAGTCGGLFILREMSRRVYGMEQIHAHELATTLSHAGRPLAKSGDREAMTRLCVRFVAEHPIRFVAFFDAEGRLLAYAGNRPELFQRLAEPGDASHKSAPRRPRIRRDPVDGRAYTEAWCSLAVTGAVASSSPDGGSAAGCVYVALDVSAAEQAVRNLAVDLFVFLFLCAGVVTTVTSVAICRMLTPLRDIARTAEAYAQDDLSARMCVRGDDEFAALARTLNAMAEGLYASRQAMLDLNAELEGRVEQRTRELEELAVRDPLTNLYNRRHFAEVLSHQFALAIRYDHDLCLVMVDLDNFKRVNDTYGHRVGDEVLMLTARVIQKCCREADVAARYGGDEFIVVLPQTSSDDATAFAARMRERLLAEAAESLPRVRADLSVGIASVKDTDVLSADGLIQEVDRALYTVKRTGKGRIGCAPRRVGEPAAV